MVFLGERATGRDNNLNLIRMLAATGVLVSHADPISQGPGTPEPLLELTGYSLGTLCVMVFFAVSGFLITMSFNRTSSRRSFLLARALRLMPGLAVNLVFVALILGPIMTTLAVSAYLAGPEPYIFMLRNLALVSLVYELPGVLDEEPYKAIVGSIWTLRHEVGCYAGVFLVGLLGAWRSQSNAGITLTAYALLLIVIGVLAIELPTIVEQFLTLSLPFAVGVAFYVWQDRLPLSWIGVVATVALAWLAKDGPLYPFAMSVAIAYTTFWFAYVPRQNWLLRYNDLGDYSYGIYLYAFPFQGAVVWAFGAQTPLENILYSLPPTVLLSIASWHLIEEPAMAAKTKILLRMGIKRPG